MLFLSIVRDEICTISTTISTISAICNSNTSIISSIVVGTTIKSTDIRIGIVNCGAVIGNAIGAICVIICTIRWVCIGVGVGCIQAIIQNTTI